MEYIVYVRILASLIPMIVSSSVSAYELLLEVHVFCGEFSFLEVVPSCPPIFPTFSLMSRPLYSSLFGMLPKAKL